MAAGSALFVVLSREGGEVRFIEGGATLLYSAGTKGEECRGATRRRDNGARYSASKASPRVGERRGSVDAGELA